MCLNVLGSVSESVPILKTEFSSVGQYRGGECRHKKSASIGGLWGVANDCHILITVIGAMAVSN